MTGAEDYVTCCVTELTIKVLCYLRGCFRSDYLVNGADLECTAKTRVL